MVRSRRILVEVRRETLRSSTLWFAAAYGAATVLLALFAVSEDAPSVYVSTVFLFLPLLFAPLAAYRVSRCRERGLGALRATAPVSRLETLAGTFLALVLLLVAGVAVSLPTSAALLDAGIGIPGQTVGALASWGLLLGVVAVAVGLLVGYAHSGDPRASVSLAFSIVLFWLVLGLQRETILSWADSPTELQTLQGVLHASPLVWGLEAQAGAGSLPGTSRQLLGPTVLAAGTLLALVSVVVGLQHADGWRPLPQAHPVGLLLLVVAVAGVAGSLATWDYPPLDAQGNREAPGEADFGPATEHARGASDSLAALLPTAVLSGLLAATSAWLPGRLNAWNT